MELDASQLYADKTWVELELQLTASERKAVLGAAKVYCDAFGVEDLVCRIDKLSGGSLVPWGGNKALFMHTDFGHLQYQTVLTLNQFGSACVASSYKQWLGDSFFAVNHSPEARKRVVLDKLQNIELIDYFFLVDRVFDQVAEFFVAQLQGLSESR